MVYWALATIQKQKDSLDRSGGCPGAGEICSSLPLGEPEVSVFPFWMCRCLG